MTNPQPEGWNPTFLAGAFVLAAFVCAAIRLVTPPLLSAELVHTFAPLEAAAAAASCLIGAAVVGGMRKSMTRGRLIIAGAACLALGELLDTSVVALAPGVLAALFRGDISSLLDERGSIEALAVAAACFRAIGPALIAAGLSRAVPADASTGRRTAAAVAVLAALAILQNGTELGRALASVSGVGMSAASAAIVAVNIGEVLAFSWLAIVAVRRAHSGMGHGRAWWALGAGALVPVVAVWLNPLIVVLRPPGELTVLSLEPVTQLLGAGLLVAAFGSGLAAGADPDVGRAESRPGG
jgi:hypothetical protein